MYVEEKNYFFRVSTIYEKYITIKINERMAKSGDERKFKVEIRRDSSRKGKNSSRVLSPGLGLAFRPENNGRGHVSLGLGLVTPSLGLGLGLDSQAWAWPGLGTWPCQF